MATRIRWNMAGFAKVRKSPALERHLFGRAALIAEACGGHDAGYYTQSSVGRSRARAAVIAGSYEAVRDNAEWNTLLDNIDAARG